MKYFANATGMLCHTISADYRFSFRAVVLVWNEHGKTLIDVRPDKLYMMRVYALHRAL
jgi:hypothetical protein